MIKPELFGHDALGRRLAAIARILPSGIRQIALVISLLVATWGVLALLATADGPLIRSAFFGDWAAYTQYLLAIPLLILGEAVIDRKTSVTTTHLFSGGLLARNTDAMRRYATAWNRVDVWRQRFWCDAILVLLAYGMTWLWLGNELTDQRETWRLNDCRLTLAGWWTGMVTMPLFHYTWLRWAWRLMLWTTFLRNLSRLPLRITALHPDGAGGLAFLGETQARFGLLMFVFGAVTTTTALYKIRVENVSNENFFTLGLLLIYLIVAPALFVAPLLVFTRKIERAKRRELHACARSTWSLARSLRSGEKLPEEVRDKVEEAQQLHSRLRQTRTLPFDFKTAKQLVLSAVTPVTPLILQLLPWEPLRVLMRVVFRGTE